MLILHGDRRSGNTRKVIWALEELGAPYELRTVDLRAGAHRQPGFLALNPLGKVPVLEDDGFVLRESDAILAYLADTRGGLVPSTPRERAIVQQWMCWNAYHLAPCTYGPRALRLTALRLGTELDRARHAELVAGATPTLAVLDDHLADRRFVAGDALTIADLAIATHVAYAVDEGAPVEPHAHVHAWFERMTARPAWKRANEGA